MAVPDPAVDAYLAQVAAVWRDSARALRQSCLGELGGFREGLRYGMPGYWRGDGELELGFAAQKQYLSLYVLRTDVLATHRDRLAGLSVGKGAVRFRRPDQIDPDAIRSILVSTASTTGPIC